MNAHKCSHQQREGLHTQQRGEHGHAEKAADERRTGKEHAVEQHGHHEVEAEHRAEVLLGAVELAYESLAETAVDKRLRQRQEDGQHAHRTEVGGQQQASQHQS